MITNLDHLIVSVKDISEAEKTSKPKIKVEEKVKVK